MKFAASFNFHEGLNVMATSPTTTTKRKPFKRERATSTKNHYVTNAELLPLIIRDKAAGKLSNELAQKLMLIAQRYSFSASFVRYSYREDMVAFAVLNLVNNWHKFDETVTSNPFAFYTTDAQKVISMVYELDGRFGKNVVAQCLVGSNNQKMKEMNASQYDHFGSLKMNQKETISLIDYLIASRYLEIEGTKYPLVHVTNRSWDCARCRCSRG